MQFNASTDIPSLTDKVILVTGGTDGLGKETVRELSLHSPTHIYFTGRNISKATKFQQELTEMHPTHAPITFLEMDLSSLASVRAAAQKLLTLTSRLDILVCNAGSAGIPSITKDGYEYSFGSNHLGHALLIQLLLPILNSTSELPDTDVRVVILSSMGEKFAPKKYTFTSMKTDLAHLGTMTRYGQSKLANIHYTSSLATRYPNITFVSVHPGTVRTNFGAKFFEGSPVMEFVLKYAIRPLFDVAEVDVGAKGQLWGATGKGVKSGEFYWPVGLEGKGSKRSKDVNMAQELWSWTEKELKPWL